VPQPVCVTTSDKPGQTDRFMSVYVQFMLVRKKINRRKLWNCSKSKYDDLGVYTNFVYAGKPRIISEW